MSRNSSKQAQAKGGFTLVELVVVIAVLAILAGVGAVAYNGYIEYAKKGQDRATVGEVLHALELADYADPSLFGEDGGAVVILTKNGIKAAGGSDSAKLGASLTDAFGPLDAVTLSYDGWKTPNMQVLKDIGGSGTAIGNYLDSDLVASFGDDMEEYWDEFGHLVNVLNGKEHIPGTTITVDAKYKDKIVDTVVNEYQTLTEEQRNNIIEKWKTNAQFGNINKIGGCDLTMARNYSFISYAKAKVTDSEMLDKLNNYSPVPFIGFSGTFTGAKWKPIVDGYFIESAEADAVAYLGLMEAANTLKTTANLGGGGDVSDDDFISGLAGYVGLVGNVLSKRTSLSDIQGLADAIGTEEGPKIVINATKMKDVLSFSVYDPDANPRKDENPSTN